MMKMTSRVLIGMIMMMSSIMACPTNWPVVENFQPTDLVGQWYDEVSVSRTCISIELDTRVQDDVL